MPMNFALLACGKTNAVQGQELLAGNDHHKRRGMKSHEVVTRRNDELIRIIAVNQPIILRGIWIRRTTGTQRRLSASPASHPAPRTHAPVHTSRQSDAADEERAYSQQTGREGQTWIAAAPHLPKLVPQP